MDCATSRLQDLRSDLPQDYEPYGETEREGGDCSCGCVFALWLEGEAGDDWCVCSNPKSHRAGLLTFEHQGCAAFSDSLGSE